MVSAIRTATEDGDTKEGVLPVGQVMGLLHDEPTVAELMERMVAEAKKQQQKLDAHFFLTKQKLNAYFLRAEFSMQIF